MADKQICPRMKEAVAGVKIIKVKVDRNGKKRFFVKKEKRQ